MCQMFIFDKFSNAKTDLGKILGFQIVRIWILANFDMSQLQLWPILLGWKINFIENLTFKI